jgi:RHS repeat-associated protein
MYTARFTDEETGLYYYRARAYSPVTGRFLQRDPLGYEPDPNLFQYVESAPCVLTDPMGTNPGSQVPSVPAENQEDWVFGRGQAGTVTREFIGWVDVTETESTIVLETWMYYRRSGYFTIQITVRLLQDVVTLSGTAQFAVTVKSQSRGGFRNVSTEQSYTYNEVSYHSETKLRGLPYVEVDRRVWLTDPFGHEVQRKYWHTWDGFDPDFMNPELYTPCHPGGMPLPGWWPPLHDPFGSSPPPGSGGPVQPPGASPTHPGAPTRS